MDTSKKQEKTQEMTRPNFIRFPVSQNELAALNSMLEELKDPHTTISNARLIPWIILYFHEHSFQKEKKRIKKDFFNYRRYMKQVLSQAKTEEEIRLAVEKIISSQRRSKTKPNNKLEGGPHKSGSPLFPKY